MFPERLVLLATEARVTIAEERHEVLLRRRRPPEAARIAAVLLLLLRRRRRRYAHAIETRVAALGLLLLLAERVDVLLLALIGHLRWVQIRLLGLWDLLRRDERALLGCQELVKVPFLPAMRL